MIILTSTKQNDKMIISCIHVCLLFFIHRILRTLSSLVILIHWCCSDNYIYSVILSHQYNVYFKKRRMTIFPITLKQIKIDSCDVRRWKKEMEAHYKQPRVISLTTFPRLLYFTGKISCTLYFNYIFGMRKHFGKRD